ncbi:alpha/beta hydrolase [Desulfuromonas versatilis]|nr:alpha/beta hydrolase [Desulfuromonas versatilis]
MNRLLPPLALAFALLILGTAALAPQPALAAMDHQFVFFPEAHLVATPALYDLPFEEVFYPTADGETIHGWLVPGDPERPLVLFCHGNAGNISHRLDNLRLFHRLLGLSVFIFDYRGYGKSSGKASEEGTYADARGALAWLQQRGWQPQRMIYFGRSLGAGVAVQLALEQPPGALVLETPFPSIAAMGWRHNPILYLLLGWALDARYDSFNKLARIHVPLLMFQGDRDHIVPEKMARGLFERANQPKTFHLIRGAGHNDTYEAGGEAYWQQWREFLQRHFPPPEKQQGEG